MDPLRNNHLHCKLPEQRDYHVAVNIVTWNSEKYIKDLLESLRAQAFQGFYIIIIDNASTDKTLDIVKEYDGITVIKNSANAGFSRAHNKGIEMALKFWEGRDLSERFIVVCNPDIVLKDDCLEILLKDIWREKHTAAVGPKLLRIHEEEKNCFPESLKTNIIDSLGLKISKSCRVVDASAGLEEKKPSFRREVFGVSGAMMCIRAKALETIKWQKEYFDEDFFAYKEDIDLCWRLRNLGWDIAVNPEAIAYHYRRVGDNSKRSLRQYMLSEKRKPPIVKFLSVRNQLWLMVKNNFLVNACLCAPFIFLEECAKFLYCLCFCRRALGAYFSFAGKLLRMLQKREYLKMARIGSAEIRAWMR